MDILNLILDAQGEEEVCGVHVKKINVILGDDDGKITETISHVSEDGQLRTQRSKIGRSAGFRMRDEPGVEIYLEEEGSDVTRILTISHHKGALLCSLHEITGEQAA